MREANEGERIVSRSDVHQMLLERLDALLSESDGDTRDKVARKAKIALLTEMLATDFRALEELKLPAPGRIIYAVPMA